MSPRALLLFASALAGRSLAPAPAGAADSGPGCLQLPAEPATTEAQHRALRIAVLRQVIDRQPGGRWAVDEADLTAAGLWGPLPSAPGPAQPAPDDALMRCLAGWPRPVLLRRLFLALEARRVDAVLASQFPGALADLRQARQAAPQRGRWAGRLTAWAAGASLLDDPAATALDSLRAALQLAATLPAGHRQGHRLAGRCEALTPPEAAAGAAASGPADVVSPADAAGAATAGAGGASADATPLATPIRGAPGPAAIQPPQPRAGPAEAATAGAARGPQPPTPLAAPDTPAGRTLSRPQEHWHDEWDCFERRYRRHWTCVRMHAVQGSQADYLATLQARHAPLLRAIRRHFSATPPSARARGGAAVDGDQLDLDQALAALIDRRAGGLGEARPYRHRPRLQRDVCTAVLLDTSGSTGFVVPPPRDAAAPLAAVDDEDDSLLYGFRPRHADRGPAPRRVIDIAHDAIALMCEGMHGLGDRHAIFGFSGQGRLQVDLRQAKGFDEPWSARSAAALAALQPEGSTRTGAAIRHAVSQLLPQPARTRVLVLVTDGYPQDQDYGPNPRDRAYGLHDTAQALREAARAGVAAFCVSIDQAAHDYLRGICPAHRYLVIDDVHRLPERLSRLYRQLTSVQDR